MRSSMGCTPDHVRMLRHQAIMEANPVYFSLLSNMDSSCTLRQWNSFINYVHVTGNQTD